MVLLMEPYETVLEKGIEYSHDKINEIRNHPDMQMAGACVQNMLLTAVDLGYGACWMSGPLVAGNELERILGIEPPEFLVAFVSVGKPALKPRPKNKKPIESLFRLID